MRFRQSQQEARSSTRRLLALFVLVVLALVLCLNGLLALLWSALTGWRGSFPPLFFEANTALVLLFVVGGTAVETMRLKAGGGRHVASWAGGREVTEPRDLHEKRLRNVVDEMAIASGQHRPAIYLLDREDAINAFAAGWSPDEAVIAVTRGAIERLTRDELQGLVAHEFGHVQQDDLRLNMVLLAMVWGLSLVFGYGQSLASENDDGYRSGPAVLIGLVFMAAGGAGWLAGQALQAAVSRQREYLADACAVQFTRSREGIGRTLRKVWHQAESGEARMREGRAAMLATLFFAAPPAWFAVHPPLRSRIKRIYGRAVAPLPSERMRALSEDGALAAGASAKVRASGFDASTEADRAMFDDAPATAPARARSGARAVAGASDAESSAGATGVAAVASGTALRERSAAVAERSSRRCAPTGAASPPLPRMEPRPSAFGGLGEDRDAMGRLALLHGPLERKSALLALLMKPQPAGPVPPGRPTEQLAAWRREVSALPSADRVLGDVRALTAAVRLPWFEKLLGRTAAAPASEHAALVDSATRLLQAGGGPDALDRLHLQVIRTRLKSASGPLKPVDPRAHAVTELSELDRIGVGHVAVVTALLEELVPADWQWVAAVMLEWDERRGGPPLQRPDDEALNEAFAGLRALPWMLRPLIIRLWISAAVDRCPPATWPRDFIDGLRLCSAALDCPLHPHIAGAYVELGGVG